jgi:hypothetical protein
MPAEPVKIDDLFRFYHDYVKLLYAAIQAENALPTEVLFELNAAFDHLSRFWIYGETEGKVVDKAFSHLKRSCLDIFKLKVKETIKRYNEILSLHIDLIDNGDFERKLRDLVRKIKDKATHARKEEGKPDADDSIPCFEPWEEVYDMCIQFEKDFYNHPSIEWADRKGKIQTLKIFCYGVLASLVASALFETIFSTSWPMLIKKGFAKVFSLFSSIP